MKAIILSIYADNLDKRIPEYQKKVMDKLNTTYPFKQVFYGSKACDARIHATIIDTCMGDEFLARVDNPEVVMFLDIDCIPIKLNAADFLIETAYGSGVGDGIFIGHAQRSNHIQNNEHIFIAPSCCAISVADYKRMKSPSAIPTVRGDVLEEWTYTAEENNFPISIRYPIKYDAPVFRMAWESDRSPSWKLKEGLPDYGIGTEFETGFWHMFQSFHPGQTERFIKKCEEVLNG